MIRLSMETNTCAMHNCQDGHHAYIITQWVVKNRPSQKTNIQSCSPQMGYSQWQHQGVHGGAFSPCLRLCPPLVPQSEEKKWPKSAIFSKVSDFFPLRIAFCPSMPPHKKILVLPLATPDDIHSSQRKIYCTSIPKGGICSQSHGSA